MSLRLQPAFAMPMIQSHRDLEAWQLGMDFVVQVYAMTNAFPQNERFALTSQLRRAAVSIPSSVSEGHQLGGKSYKHFVSLALGSLAEVNTQFEIAARLRYVSDADFSALTAQSSRLRQVLHGLKRSLHD